MMRTSAGATHDVIPAKAGTHATIVQEPDTRVGARLRGHDAAAPGAAP
jgi:hypothetical protein